MTGEGSAKSPENHALSGRVDDLEHKLCSLRSKTIDWWLRYIAIFLGVGAIFLGLIGFIAYSEFEESKDEMTKANNEMKKMTDEMTEMTDDSRKFYNEIKTIYFDLRPDVKRLRNDSEERIETGLEDNTGKIRRESPRSIQIRSKIKADKKLMTLDKMLRNRDERKRSMMKPDEINPTTK